MAMSAKPSSALKHLSLMTLLEGGSLIALVAIAMPLKYMADMPAAVSAVGPVHGAFYLWTMGVLALTLYRRLLPLKHGAVVAIAALIPFGGLFSHHLVKRRLQGAG
jgi:integral membrane protein